MSQFAYNYELKYLNPKYDDLKAVKEFLKKFDLHYDADIEKTIVIRSQNEIIATGSFSRNVIKDLAVNPDYQGEGLLNTLITKLNQLIFDSGYTKIFAYTKADNVDRFRSLGFTEITRLGDYPVFMESSMENIEASVIKLKNKLQLKLAQKFPNKSLEELKIASITVNCNPITKGHLYLIEKAAKANDLVIIFVLDEDLSLFPADIRYRLVKKATAEIDNLIVFKSGQYMISHVTFPSYFIGPDNEEKRNTIYAELDAKIFAEYFARILAVDKRYVGKEPYSPVTNTYNQALQKYLPAAGVELEIVDRKDYEGQVISASTVRQHIRDGEIEKIKNLVPQATYDFIKSKEAKAIRKKIKNTNSRH